MLSNYHSSEGAEYIIYGKNLSSGLMPYSRRSFLKQYDKDVDDSSTWCKFIEFNNLARYY